MYNMYQIKILARISNKSYPLQTNAGLDNDNGRYSIAVSVVYCDIDHINTIKLSS